MNPSRQAIYRMNYLRENQKRDYRYLFSKIMHHLMTQVSLNQGLKKFKNKGEKSFSKELLHLHLKIAFRPLTGRYISDKEK